MFTTSQMASVALTLYTDALVIHGSIRTFHRRITDILNETDVRFLVLHDVSYAEHGSSAPPTPVPYAQVNLDAVLFAVADDPVEPRPELRARRISEPALVSVPPFSVVGTIHLPPREGELRESLEALTGAFLPVTDAAYWSERLHEGRRQALVVAVNHHRAQIMAPFRSEDPWAGLGHDTGAGEVEATAGVSALGGGVGDGPAAV